MQDKPVDYIVAVNPEPRCEISIRLATITDMPFIDELQKMHSHMVGWFPRKQMESYIETNDVIIAEDENSKKIGYCVARDRYSGRDDVGIIYQLNVLPMSQRNLVGAALVKAVFNKAAYGCKLFCCWCAQDIQANWFWESIGFVPLAFRTGSRGKQRIHIFWQRHVRENTPGIPAPGTSGVTPTLPHPDTPTPSPYWFPYQTRAGAVREDRLVLPIPPGLHWRDVMPMVLPELLPGVLPGVAGSKDDSSRLLDGKKKKSEPKVTTSRKIAVIRSKSKHLQGLPPGKAAVVTAGGLRYVERGDHVPEPPESPEVEESSKKKKRASKPRAKHDPKHVAQARELRDRFLEQVNEQGLLPAEWAQGKYEVGRSLDDLLPDELGAQVLQLGQGD